MSLFVAKLDRYDMVNNPQCNTACFTIWFAGCNFHCNECQNPQLWDREFGGEWSTSDLYNTIITIGTTIVTTIVVIKYINTGNNICKNNSIPL